jgi:hypothetical protein
LPAEIEASLAVIDRLPPEIERSTAATKPTAREIRLPAQAG